MPILYAVGDGATGNTDSQTLADHVTAAKPDAFLYLGDVYETGTASEFQANYKPAWGQLDHCVYAIPGNHDWPNYQAGYKPYFDQAGRHSEPYYTVDLGGAGQAWRLIMLNSEQPMDPSSEQYQWAENQIPFGRRNIACWHRPRYCSGSHGDAVDTDPLWQLLAPHCPVILGGHAHNCQQFKPDSTGCRQLVSGAGGRGLYAEIPDDPRLEWGEASGYAVLRLELNADHVALTWVDEQGSTLHESTVPV